MDALESRIARLEQSNRRLRFLAGGVAILFGVVLGVAVISNVIAVRGAKEVAVAAMQEARKGDVAATQEATTDAVAADLNKVVEKLRVRTLEIVDNTGKVKIHMSGAPYMVLENHKGDSITLMAGGIELTDEGKGSLVMLPGNIALSHFDLRLKNEYDELDKRMTSKYLKSLKRYSGKPLSPQENRRRL